MSKSLSRLLLRSTAILATAVAGVCAGDAPPAPPPPVSSTPQAAPPGAPPAPTPPTADGHQARANRNGDVTIRIVTMDANGEITDDSHKVLDDLMEQGWRATNMTVVSSTAPITLAVMLTMPPKRPPMQIRPGGQPFAPGQQQPQPPFSAGPAPSSPAPASAGPPQQR